MQSIKRLSDVDRSMTNLVGGKAASLGEMIKAGIKVPPGFVITTEAYGKAISPQLKQDILKAFDELGSELVAVRSSAVAEDSNNASWAGQLETYLNVNMEGLLNAIEKCWASMRSKHAQDYADYNRVAQNQRAVAVVIQSMVDSEISGVIFTANPVTGNRDELIIESVYGLGEMVVQGMVTPDSWTVNKGTELVASSNPRRQSKMLVYKNGDNKFIKVPDAKRQKPTLNSEQIKKLVRVSNKIEQQYGQPQDIEWAIAAKRLYILQSRPITTLNANKPKASFTFEKLFTREESLMVSEIQYNKFKGWLSLITAEPIPPSFFRIRDGLLETWLCKDATKAFIDDIYQRNITEKTYLSKNIALYKKLVARMDKYEKLRHARNLNELKEYLSLFSEVMVPLHVIFFTPLRDDTPKPLLELALKMRGQDAVFDNSDLYIKDSLSYLYPACNGIESFIGLKDLDGPEPEILKKRQDDFFWAENEYLTMDFDTFKATHPDHSFVIDEFDPSQTTITGTPAFKGRVSGQAQIITRKKDITKFKSGSILVAPMTTPHYLPAMQRAAAFITDEGGVTCHAAIVSRELKIPCIIGTKIATQVLKNGDLIDVDATSGIITIKNGTKSNKQVRLTKQPPTPKGIKYALTVPQSVLFAELSLQASLRPVFKSVLGIDFEPQYIVIDAGGAMSWNYDNDKTFNTAMMSGRSLGEALSNFVDTMAATARKLERRSSLASSHVRRANNHEDLLEDLEEYWRAYRSHMVTLFSFWNVENLVARAITNELRRTGHETAIQGLDQFIKSNETNQFVRERACFEKIVRRFAGGNKDINDKTASPKLLVALYHHVREFGFLLTPFNLGNAPSVESLLPRVNEVQRNLSEKTSTVQELISPKPEISFTPKLKRLANILERLTFWKNERIDVLSMADARMETLYQEVAENLGLAIEELFNMTSGEIIRSLRASKLMVSRQLLADRAKEYCLILQDGKIDFYQPSRQHETKDSSLRQNSNLLQGLGSSSGTAKGKVRLLLSLEESAQLETGEVLVTTMTRPEMGAALDRAAAFVTDEGGLLCHAAIISREMKKPCVIATANATKVLKTGDLIEVDGSKGTVKIIL